tara:strand:- start:1849 stop:3078 length:1230 start_codon:yes stop_codon:yes gene_type:complete
MEQIKSEPLIKSSKLDDVCYDIRGAVALEAKRLEDEGHKIMPLHIGNPAAFGFDAPHEMVQDIIKHLPVSQGYCESKGLFSARKAVVQKYQLEGVHHLEPEQIYIGNGVSELILMAMQALLNDGDEMLIPAPDYPLWTAATYLSGGKAVHYRCDESSNWFPDLEDMRAKITSKTRGILLINPNNPTGAVYSASLLNDVIELCRQHNLILFSDEIYDKIIYDGVEHIPCARLADDIVIVTFNGLSKGYRAAGFRIGWMMLTGPLKHAKSYIEGIDILASMRLCGNVPCQYAIQTALGGYQSIDELILPQGRLTQQRDMVYNKLLKIEGVSCIKPQGALYAFAKLDRKKFNLVNDEQLVLDFLKKEKILIVQGTAFNWPEPDHVRIVFLPHKEDLAHAVERLGIFLEQYSQ